MATLVRTKDTLDEPEEHYSSLQSDIPAPFPIDAYRKEQEHHALLNLGESAELEDPFADHFEEDILAKDDGSMEREQDNATASQESVSIAVSIVVL